MPTESFDTLALFVAIVKRACADRGVVVGHPFNGAQTLTGLHHVDKLPPQRAVGSSPIGRSR